MDRQSQDARRRARILRRLDDVGGLSDLFGVNGSRKEHRCDLIQRRTQGLGREEVAMNDLNASVPERLRLRLIVAEHPQIDIGIAQPVEQGTPDSARCAGDQHKPSSRHVRSPNGLCAARDDNKYRHSLDDLNRSPRRGPDCEPAATTGEIT
jgi:hypothetical protein